MHQFKHSTGITKKCILPVNVYTSGDEAELFLNGKSLGRKSKKEGQDFRLVWDSVVYKPGELKVIAYKNGKRWATDVVKTTGEAAKLTLNCSRKEINNDGSDLAFITVLVQDKDGLTVPRSNLLLQFEIEGPVKLLQLTTAMQRVSNHFKVNKNTPIME